MHRESLQLLRDLVNVPSPSGCEVRVQEVVRRRMQRCCDELTTDVNGNVIGVMNPRGTMRVMLAGHCDEIGLMITHIDDKGFIYVAAVGGIDPAVAAGQRVKINASKRSVTGVMGRKPIHLMEKDEIGKPLKMHELWIDIGAKSRKDAEKIVSVGDYVTFDVELQQLQNGLVTARGLDDRVGAFVIIETMRRLKGKKLDVAVYGVTTTQEEIGLRGAKTSAYGIAPHVGIAIDVGHASDFPGSEPKKSGECALGKGLMMHRGPNINPVLGQMLEAIASRKKVPFQITAEPRATGTDANSIQISRKGVATALVSIPTRYMHTPVEVVALRDMENASVLVSEFILSLKSGVSFVPRV